MFRIENYEIILDEIKLNEPKYIKISAWLYHIPLAYLIINVLKPKIFVELGTHTGASYNAFCYAVKKLNLQTKCFAVDTWEGDPHSLKYSIDIYNELLDFNEKNYSNFSKLLKMTFQEAVYKFENKSIDLLHIDGYHTYEAVKSDFNTWLPKLSDRGVVLLHDTTVKERDFGVYKLYDELQAKYDSYNIKHGYGLGIILVGSKVEEEFKYLIDAFKNNFFYEKLFYRLGEIIIKDIELEHTRGELNAVYNSKKWRIAVKLEKIARKTGLIYVVKGMLNVYFFVKKTLNGK